MGGTVRPEQLTMRATTFAILLFLSIFSLIQRAKSSPQNHFLRSLRSSKDLQRILRSSQPSLDGSDDHEDPDQFLRDLRTTGHFLRSLRSSEEDGAYGHFLRSLRSNHDFMRMVRRSDGHFLRSLRDTAYVQDSAGEN